MPTAKKRTRAVRKPPLTFNHAMIYVSDVDRALRFYRDALGFTLIDRFDGEYARLGAPRGRSTIALHRQEEGYSAGGAGFVRLYFEVRDLERFCKRLEKSGVRLKQGPAKMPWGWRHAYLDDPDGHEVSLYWAGAARWRKSK